MCARLPGVISLTFPCFLVSVYVVLELDADLSLCGLIFDERVFQKLLCRTALGVIFDHTLLNETVEFL